MSMYELFRVIKYKPNHEGRMVHTESAVFGTLREVTPRVALGLLSEWGSMTFDNIFIGSSGVYFTYEGTNFLIEGVDGVYATTPIEVFNMLKNKSDDGDVGHDVTQQPQRTI